MRGYDPGAGMIRRSKYGSDQAPTQPAACRLPSNGDRFNIHRYQACQQERGRKPFPVDLAIDLRRGLLYPDSLQSQRQALVAQIPLSHGRHDEVSRAVLPPPVRRLASSLFLRSHHFHPFSPSCAGTQQRPPARILRQIQSYTTELSIMRCRRSYTSICTLFS